MIRKLSNNASVVIVVLAGFAYLAYLFQVSPERAEAQFLPVIGIVGTLARLLYQVAVTEQAAVTASEQAKTAVAAVAENTAVTQQIDAKVDTAVEKVDTNAAVTQQIDAKVDTVATKGDATYGLVDGQMTDFRQMYAEFAALKAELAAERGHAAGITEGREQAGRETGPHAATAAPISPSDAAALGAADAVRAVEPGASAGEVADAAAQGAADATEAKP